MTILRLREKLSRAFQNSDKVYSLFDTALTSIFRLASSIVLAKLAGAEVFAQYVLITSGIVIIQSLAQNYFTTPVIHSAGLKKNEIAQLFKWSARRLRVFQLVLVAVFGGIFGYADLSGNSTRGLLYIGFALSSVLLLSIQHIKAYRQTRFDNRRMLISNICGISLHLIIFVFGLLSSDPTVQALEIYGWGLFANYVVVYVISRSALIASWGRSLDISNLPSATLVGVRKDGLFMMLGSLTGIFSSRLQPFVLVTFTSALAVAQFGAVMTIAGPVRMSSMFLQNVLRPRFALYHNQQNHVAFRRLRRQSIFFLMAMGAVGMIISLFIEAWLLDLCFGLNESIPAGILTLALAYTTLDSITSCQMLSMQVGIKNGVAITTKLRFISAVVCVILIIPFCYYGGAIGALLSLLAGELIYWFLASRIQIK